MDNHEKLQRSLANLLAGQDQDSVNVFFAAFAGDGQFVSVDLLNGVIAVHDKETGELDSQVRFEFVVNLR